MVCRQTPFHFQLPISQSAPKGKALYWLTGARLVNYKNNPAALVAYGENQSSGRLQQISDRGRRRRSTVWRPYISLSKRSKLRGVHLGQSRSCIRVGGVFNGFPATLLFSLPSEYGGPESCRTLRETERQDYCLELFRSKCLPASTSPTSIASAPEGNRTSHPVSYFQPRLNGEKSNKAEHQS